MHVIQRVRLLTIALSTERNGCGRYPTVLDHCTHYTRLKHPNIIVPANIPRPKHAGTTTSTFTPFAHAEHEHESLPSTMLISGFTNAPVSRLLVIWVVAGSLLASITDTKYYFHILVVPHLWTDWQVWRILTWQVGLYTGR